MSRHRNVRALDYDHEYDDAIGDFEYGQSVEDDYGVSPSVEMYMYDRNQPQHQMGAFMHSEEDIQEEDEEEEEEVDEVSRRLRRLDSATYTAPVLTDFDRARLNSCLDEVRSAVGENFPEPILIDTIVSSGFDCEKTLDALLSSNRSEEDPKPQRDRRRDRGRLKQDNLPENLTSPSEASRLITVITPDQTPHQKIGFDVESEEPNTTTDFNETTNQNGEALLDNEKSSTDLVKSSKTKDRRETADAEYAAARSDDKVNLNMVVIGHVDAGKSTLMGHLLYQLGAVSSRAMHKYEQESKKLGKQSFMYAWVLDETGEERSRGITMDVGQSRFSTDTKLVTLLDAPGHKDFIPNMITGASQADCAILVVDATRGEFETGFDSGGQTREHALLVRSLGVSQLAVAINKLDTVDWSQERFEEIKAKLRQFLQKNVGFRDTDLSFVPVSGLTGENLTKAVSNPELKKWYNGPTLLQVIDQLNAPERPVAKPFRLSVSDVWKGQGSGFCVGGRIETGMVFHGDKVYIMPQGEQAQVKGISIDDISTRKGFAGDQAVLTLSGMDMQNVGVGSVICEVNNPIAVSSKLEARIVVFNISVPITTGFPAILYNGTISEPCTISKLKCQLHRSTGEVVKHKPRFLTKHTSAIVHIQLNKAVPMETFSVAKELGRFMIRTGGSTIAAGLVTKIL